MQPTLRKAAILVASLDTTSADALLEGMEPEEAARVRRAVLELGDVDPAEQQQIMNDFLRRQPRLALADQSAVELDPSLVARLRTSRAADDVAPRAAAPAPSFAFLQPLDTAELARVLGREHPQTIAIVISHLPPARAADVLRRLPTALQSETLMRVARLGNLAPDIVQDVEQALRAVVEGHVALEPVAPHGVAAIAAILQAASGAERQALLTDLSRQDPVLAQHFGHRFPSTVPVAAEASDHAAAEPVNNALPRPVDRRATVEPSSGEVRPPAVLFADLEQLQDAALAQVLRHASPATAILALAGASPPFVERILGQLPAREAAQIQRKMQQLGPLRLDDIERAQLRLADIAQQLMAQGKIPPPPVARFTVAA